ncbi:hypothetical protein F0726_00233 [Acidithiobacillus caldus]|nr:hypothetical protein F0726_00233 [Acidithiobacillus caldus]
MGFFEAPDSVYHCQDPSELPLTLLNACMEHLPVWLIAENG